MASAGIAERTLSRIESITGRVTMYRLVLLVLVVLGVVALALSTLGVIPYSPSAMVVTAGVTVVASYASNRLFAAMFGVTPHSESSIITGLLLFFIFPPSDRLLALLTMAMAGILASASKYILAVRGRHVFNPAAAGAFLAGLIGVYQSGWWAATPALLPFTAAAALLILHRTRRLPMGIVFLLTAAGVMAVRSLAAGQTLVSALTWPWISSPIVFFAALMLSEPLTQPPLRHQQLAFAVVVGALFSVPMHLGTVYLAPESALMIGNALAFLVGQRKGIELVLRRRTRLTPSTLEFCFQPTRSLSFRPGQYLELTVPHKGADSRGLRRVFSIASAPGQADSLTIGTKVPERASTFKQALGDLRPGTVLSATAIAGDFTLPRSPRARLLLVAGGIGITPFASQLAGLPATHRRDIVVVYSVSSPDEVCYREILVGSGARVVLVCPEPVDDLPDGWRAVPARRIDRDLLIENVPDISRRRVLISGPPLMVDGVGAAARALRARAVKTDFFSGY